MIALSLSQLAQALQLDYQGVDVDFRGICTDTRVDMTGQLFVALKGEHFDAHQFVDKAAAQGAVALLVQQPVASDLPQLCVPDSRKALLEIAAFWRASLDLPLVAVTGSNGKTSVKELLRSIFSAQVGAKAVHATAGNFNNDIGVPLTLFGLDKQHRYAVIEMGANHLGEIAGLTAAARPDVAVITLCAPAHLEGFGDKDGVARAKGEIFQSLSPTGTAVINADDDYADYWRGLNPSSRQILTFATDSPADVYAEAITLSIHDSHWRLCTPQGQRDIQLPLAGKHNIKNALAASACALAIGCDLDAIAQGLAQVQPPKGRLQQQQLGKRLVWDDSYNANPSSVKAGIDVLACAPAPRYLMLGDLGELGADVERWHAELGEYAKQAELEGLYTVGEYSRHASKAFGDGAQHFDEMQSLQAHLRQQLPEYASILIKGSRSARMERLLEVLQA